MLLPCLDDPRVRTERPDVVSVDGRVLSTAQLVDAVEALAERLAGAGVVAVDATASLETVVAVLAALRAGVAVVPVPPDAGPREWAHILGDSRAALLLTTRPDLPAGAEGLSAHPVSVDGRPAGTLPEPAHNDGPALVLYTSGTTGPPKGVVVGRSAIAADLNGLAEAWGWTAEDVVVHGLPLFHVHGLVLGLLGALRAGGRFVHVGRPSPENYARAAADGGTMFFGVPTVWGRIAADASAARSLRTARLLVSGSAGLPRPTFERMEQVCGQAPVERYGMTETLITLAARYDGPRIPGSVGWPITGVESRLVDEVGQPVPADGETVGSLQIRGSTLMTGYLDRPDATGASFTRDGWFITGDAAIMAPDGSHRIVGRESSELIKTGGFRVGAGEVEGALLAHPKVQEAAVVGRPHPDLGQVIVAYVVADGVASDELIAWVGDGLSAHKRPREVRFVDSLPRNAMGKVQKSRLDAG